MSKNQQRLDWARQRSIDPDMLVKKYGIRFVGNLIEYLTKTEKVGPRVRPAIYPQIKKFRWGNEQQIEQYFEDLEEAGFKIKNKPEDFIDEDTGQIVTLQRKFLYYLKNNK